MFELFSNLLVFAFLHLFKIIDHIMKARNLQKQFFYFNSMFCVQELDFLVFGIFLECISNIVGIFIVGSENTRTLQ